MVDLICDIDPRYKKFILINKKTGKKKLYGKLTKAVYDMYIIRSYTVLPKIKRSVVWLGVQIEYLWPVYF